MNKSCRYRNYMDEMLDILNEIDCRYPEPEVCNVRCPPLGCPRGPCLGMCCYEGSCDPCCVSQVPCCPPPPHRPRCRAPPTCWLKAYAKAVGYPPESPLSPVIARIRNKPCYDTLAAISRPEPAPVCTAPPCPSPCCAVVPSNPFPYF